MRLLVERGLPVADGAADRPAALPSGEPSDASAGRKSKSEGNKSCSTDGSRTSCWRARSRPPALSAVLHAQQQPGMPGSGAAEPGLVASRRAAAARRSVSFAQRLDEQLPLDAVFRDDEGREVTLGRVLRPPAGAARVRVLRVPDALLAGDERHLLGAQGAAVHGRAATSTSCSSASIRGRRPSTPRPEARASGALVRRGDGRRLAPADGRRGEHPPRDRGGGLHLPVGRAESGQFAHVSGLLVATPDGRLSRYFYGVQFSPRELRMALVESGEGRIGSAHRRAAALLLPLRPRGGPVRLVVMNLLRLGGAMTVVLLGGFILVMRRREMRAGVERPV
jgi:protein SCO1